MMLAATAAPEAHTVYRGFSRARSSATRTFPMLRVKIPGRSQRSGGTAPAKDDEKRIVTTVSATTNRTTHAAPVHIATCRQIAAETAASTSRRFVKCGSKTFATDPGMIQIRSTRPTAMV